MFTEKFNFISNVKYTSHTKGYIESFSKKSEWYAFSILSGNEFCSCPHHAHTGKECKHLKEVVKSVQYTKIKNSLHYYLTNVKDVCIQQVLKVTATKKGMWSVSYLLSSGGKGSRFVNPKSLIATNYKDRYFTPIQVPAQNYLNVRGNDGQEFKILLVEKGYQKDEGVTVQQSFYDACVSKVIPVPVFKPEVEVISETNALTSTPEPKKKGKVNIAYLDNLFENIQRDFPDMYTPLPEHPEDIFTKEELEECYTAQRDLAPDPFKEQWDEFKLVEDLLIRAGYSLSNYESFGRYSFVFNKGGERRGEFGFSFVRDAWYVTKTKSGSPIWSRSPSIIEKFAFITLT